MSGESNIIKDFDAILKDIKKNGRNINLHPLIIKLPNAEKVVLKIDYGYDEAFNIFDKIDN